MNEIEIQSGLAPTPGYRYAKQVGKQLFVAGQVPHDAAGNLVGEANPHDQASQCLANLQTLLSCHDFDEQHIQHLTIHVVGPRNNLTSAWQAILNHFSNAVPPATLLGASTLGHEGQLVEIDATVVKG